ncbi:MAG: hypothetical protein KG003_03710 [Bacteroidetes bacterium]|nr:hypothetical protein [Bacteroidota bacterium]
MENSNQYLLFIVIVSAVAVAFLLFIAVDIFMLYRMKQIKNRNKIIEMETRFVKEIHEAKTEATQQVMRDIGQELHDNIGQNLTVSMMQLNRITSSDPLLNQTAELLKSTMKEVRQLSHQLAGDLMENLDFSHALERIASNIQKTGTIQMKIQVEPLPDSFSKSLELLLLRVVQEIIQNTLKHASATEIEIVCNSGNKQINLEYRDNGKGFDLKSKSDGLGMASIQKRLEILRADYRIFSEPGKGFQLTANIPL